MGNWQKFVILPGHHAIITGNIEIQTGIIKNFIPTMEFIQKITTRKVNYYFIKLDFIAQLYFRIINAIQLK